MPQAAASLSLENKRFAGGQPRSSLHSVSIGLAASAFGGVRLKIRVCR